MPEEKDHLYRLRHSLAHVMAQAVREVFAEAKLGIGPPIEDGFYYDFDLPRALTPDDLQEIERRMRRQIEADYPFERQELTPDEARKTFAHQPFKLELIDLLDQGRLRDEGATDVQPDEPLTIYRHGPFTDLCRGPHLGRTGEIPEDAFKLTSIAGAYWRGDEKRPMLQRIYGTAWQSQSELERHLWRQEEARKRDHRRVGPELDLFSFHDFAPGAPFWHPKGMVVRRALEDFSREEQRQRGYHEVSTPLLVRKELWEQSGHSIYFNENMFWLDVDKQGYALKPMNCPEATLIYRTRLRSYRDLPLRLADYGVLHRNERSGTLHGLLRVRQMQQDDCHIFCTPEQLNQEIAGVLELWRTLYGPFGFEPEFFLSTRPEEALGDPALWDKAETRLAEAIRANNIPYQLMPGEGAFYGPKIDIYVEDALGRSWQTATIQVDFTLPERFDLEYVAADGSRQRPVMIHRALFGSLERFAGILIEHLAGAFPVWLAPVQAVVIPVKEDHLQYARQVEGQLKEAGLRVEVDASDDRVGAKIRQAQLQKVPYMLVAGGREAAEGTVSVRLRTEEDLGPQPVEAFVERALTAIREKRPL